MNSNVASPTVFSKSSRHSNDPGPLEIKVWARFLELHILFQFVRDHVHRSMAICELTENGDY